MLKNTIGMLINAIGRFKSEIRVLNTIGMHRNTVGMIVNTTGILKSESGA